VEESFKSGINFLRPDIRHAILGITTLGQHQDIPLEPVYGALQSEYCNPFVFIHILQLSSDRSTPGTVSQVISGVARDENSWVEQCTTLASPLDAKGVKRDVLGSFVSIDSVM